MTANSFLYLQILRDTLSPKEVAAKAGLLQVCLHFLYWLVSLHRQCQDVLAIKGKKTKLSIVVYHQNIMVVRAGFYLDQKYLL